MASPLTQFGTPLVITHDFKCKKPNQYSVFDTNGTEVFWAENPCYQPCSQAVTLYDMQDQKVMDVAFYSQCCSQKIVAKDPLGNTIGDLRPPTLCQKITNMCSCKHAILLRMCDNEGTERYTLRAPSTCEILCGVLTCNCETCAYLCPQCSNCSCGCGCLSPFEFTLPVYGPSDDTSDRVVANIVFKGNSHCVYGIEPDYSITVNFNSGEFFNAALMVTTAIWFDLMVFAKSVGMKK